MAHLHFEDRGEGVPLLLFHGFPFTSESWWPLLDAPPKGVRIIAPDHRGFGRSERVDGPTTMETFAEDGLALLDRLKIDRAFIGGLSMGGYVAIAATRLDPGRVAGLLLCDTMSVADDDAGKARRETVAVDVETNGPRALVDGLMAKLFAPGADATTKARVEKMMLAQDPRSIAAASRGMATRRDGKDILSRFAGPCAVVVGAQDVITPVERAKVMVDLVAGSTLHVIEGAGHLSPLEKQDAFRDVVASFARG
ncbi:MAG: alpha/beta hydrolase [Archangium sp.]